MLGIRGVAPPFLTSALDGGEWSASRPGRFTSQKESPGNLWIGGWLGPRVGLVFMMKRNILHLPGIEPRPSSPLPVVYQLSYPSFFMFNAN
jgi:hypothetical protein